MIATDNKDNIITTQIGTYIVKSSYKVSKMTNEIMKCVAAPKLHHVTCKTAALR